MLSEQELRGILGRRRPRGDTEEIPVEQTKIDKDHVYCESVVVVYTPREDCRLSSIIIADSESKDLLFVRKTDSERHGAGGASPIVIRMVPSSPTLFLSPYRQDPKMIFLM